jgi:hypothetical protein
MIKNLICIAGLNCRAGDATEASVAIWQQKGLIPRRGKCKTFRAKRLNVCATWFWNVSLQNISLRREAKFISTPLRNGNSETNQMIVFWIMFFYCGYHYEKNFRTSVFSREIFRISISLVVKLGLNRVATWILRKRFTLLTWSITPYTLFLVCHFVEIWRKACVFVDLKVSLNRM